MTRQSFPILIVLSIIIAVALATNLHATLAPILWLILIGLWAAYFWSENSCVKAVGAGFSRRGRQRRPFFTQMPLRGTRRLKPAPTVRRSLRRELFLILTLLAAATVVRLYRLTEFPLGPFVDEIFTLNSSLLLLEKPFDPFGHTLLISEAWGKDHPNLFLYFNLPILKLFGVSYWSMKLLSVIPGVIACGAVFLISRRLFDRRVALGTALLFAFAHWSVRLSRYGWDVSLMIMIFALAIWLLLLARESGHAFYGYCSGIAAGLCLYSYLGARIAVLSLMAFLALDSTLRRERSIYRQAIGFVIGTAAAAYPFLSYYLTDPAAFWARTSAVSILNTRHPIPAILNNIKSHALMFHWMGGTFARDNFPGLPMMDPLTGLLLIAGLVVLIRKADTFARLIACTFVFNFAGGVLSISQEGAPYVYRTAAIIVPAFLIVGLGLEWLINKVGPRWFLVWCAITIGLNLYLYFGLEAQNTAAMRVMASEPRLIGMEIGGNDLPVWLVSSDVPAGTQLLAKPGEQYPQANPAVVLPAVVRRLAIINFSGRYDLHKPVFENLERPKDIYFVEPTALATGGLQLHGPARIIFNSGNPEMTQTVTRLGASIKYLVDILGEPRLTVADLPAEPKK